MLIKLTLLLCLVSAVLGFYLGKSGEKRFSLIALVPFVFVTIVSIHDLYYVPSGNKGGPPMTPILFFTLAAPMAISYLMFFKVGFGRAK